MRTQIKNPRRHHYIPQFYLANFCDAQEKLSVLDKSRFRRFRTGTQNVAQERDFLRLEGENVEDSFALEKEMAALEGKFAPIIKKILAGREMPTKDDLEILLCFVAFTATKIPQKRTIWNDFMGQIGERVLSLLLQDERRWEQALRESEIDLKGRTVRETFEDGRRKLKNGDLKFDASQNSHLFFFMESAKILGDLLPRRNWGLLVSDELEFITSDNPVVLTWIKPIGDFYSPGFGLPGTAVHFPLSPNVTLIGTFEPIPPVSKLTKKMAAPLNSLALLYSDKFIFSRIEEFECFKDAGTIENASAIVERAKRASGNPKKT